MNVRHGFLEVFAGMWVRIDAIHMVGEASQLSERQAGKSAIYAGAADYTNGGALLCDRPVEEVLALIERERRPTHQVSAR